MEADTHRDTLSIGGDSPTDPSSENPPTEGGSSIRSNEADTDVAPNIGVCVSRGDSAQSTAAANPVNSGETDSAPVGTCETSYRDTRDMRSETGESSEEESPIRNIKG